MIEISFEIGSRRSGRGVIERALRKAVIAQIRSDISRKLRGIRDPETGQVPRVKVKGRNLEDLSFEVEGTSELVDLVKKRLA